MKAMKIAEEFWEDIPHCVHENGRKCNLFQNPIDTYAVNKPKMDVRGEKLKLKDEN